MPRYYCDYCDMYLTHDSAIGRKQHNYGWKHRENYRVFYAAVAQQKLQVPRLNIGGVCATKHLRRPSLALQLSLLSLSMRLLATHANYLSPAAFSPLLLRARASRGGPAPQVGGASKKPQLDSRFDLPPPPMPMDEQGAPSDEGRRGTGAVADISIAGQTMPTMQVSYLRG